MKTAVAGCLLLVSLFVADAASHADEPQSPNILFLFADDWGRYASIYAEVNGPGGINDVVRTPHFDRVARQGVLFRNAHVNAPSCTPCRSSLLSGQYFWRTGRGAILRGAVWDDSIPSYPLLLRDAGYEIGKTYKVWSPGTPADAPYGGQRYSFQKSGRRFNQFSQNLAQLTEGGESLESAKNELYDEVRGNFSEFLASRDSEKPFCYWFGPTNVHRTWVKGSGQQFWGIDPDSLKGRMPPYLPDVPEVREDLADYFGEIAAWDAAIGVLLDELEKTGESDHTLIVISGDHGAPGFPHGKCNLYGFGTGVALAIQGPGVEGGRVVDDFVNLTDLAPTFLEAAEVPVPDEMTGRSLWPVLRSDESGLVDDSRTWVVTGRERHVEIARADYSPYPQRAIRTADHLLIVNFRPDRWPLGDPYRLDGENPPTAEEITETTRVTHPDEDAGPTKAWLVGERHSTQWKSHYEWVYGKRPKYELYDLNKDPHETNNVADDPKFAEVKAELEKRLMDVLVQSGDPRLVNEGEYFETPPLAGPLPDAATFWNKTKRRERTPPTPDAEGASAVAPSSAMEELPAEARPGKTFVYKHSAGQPREMEIYFPPDHDPKTASVPGVILFHGGGWSGGSLRQFRTVCEYFARRGLVAATANYRMLSKPEVGRLPEGESRKRACITDAKSAIRWFKQHAAELGVDAKRIVTGGGSAGGHISALATLNPGLDDPQDPQGIDTSVVAYLWFNPAFAPDDRQDREVDVLQFLDSEVAPAITFFGTDDAWKQGWDEVHETLFRHGNTTTDVWIADGQGHGFFNRDPWQTKTLIAADRFLVGNGLLQGEPTLVAPGEAQDLVLVSPERVSDDALK